MTSSRVFVLPTSVLLIAGSCSAQNLSPVKPSFSISLSAPRTEFKLGSPIVLRLTEKNISDHELSRGVAGVGGGETGRLIDVKLCEAQGKPVPETDHGKLIHHRLARAGSFSGMAQRFIRPGESFYEEVDLSRDFDLNKPGKYTVYGEHFDYDSNTLVKSNTITLTITN